MANLSGAGCGAARPGSPRGLLQGTLYVSEQVHASNAKAAADSTGGVPQRERPAPSACTPELRMDVGALREMLAADRAAGGPFFVVASPGPPTPVDRPHPGHRRDRAAPRPVAPLDAAYGGFFQLTARARVPGIDRADSITLDPHKGIFLPTERVRSSSRRRPPARGALHRRRLPAGLAARRAAQLHRHLPELSRDFRGLRVWLPLRSTAWPRSAPRRGEAGPRLVPVRGALDDPPSSSFRGARARRVVPFRLRDGSAKAASRLLDLIERVEARGALQHGRRGPVHGLRACILSAPHPSGPDRGCTQIVRRAVADVTGRRARLPGSAGA